MWHWNVSHSVFQNECFAEILDVNPLPYQQKLLNLIKIKNTHYYKATTKQLYLIEVKGSETLRLFDPFSRWESMKAVGPSPRKMPMSTLHKTSTVGDFFDPECQQIKLLGCCPLLPAGTRKDKREKRRQRKWMMNEWIWEWREEEGGKGSWERKIEAGGGWRGHPWDIQKKHFTPC